MHQKLVFSIILMFFSPILTLLNGLRSKNTRYKKWLLIIFITFFGSIITIPELADGTRHQGRVYSHYVDLSFHQFIEESYEILTFKFNPVINEDLYIHLLSYFVGGILGAPGLFFVFVSFIYAYFFSSSIFKLLNFVPRVRYDWLFYGIIIIFLLWKNIEGINTVRTWTGLWILFYGALSYYQTRKRIYLLFILLPVHIHIGYFIMTLPAWIVVLFGSRPLTYSTIFMLSFFVTFVNPEAIITQLKQTEVGKEKADGYYVEDIVEANTLKERDLNKTWYKITSKIGFQDWAISLIAVILIFSGLYLKEMTFLESHLFSIGILTKALANTSWFLFALSNRSNVIAGLFILAVLVLVMQRGYLQFRSTRNRSIQRFGLSISLILLLPFVVLKISQLTYLLSLFMFFIPVIPWVSVDLNLSIREALGYIIGK